MKANSNSVKVESFIHVWHVAFSVVHIQNVMNFNNLVDR